MKKNQKGIALAMLAPTILFATFSNIIMVMNVREQNNRINFYEFTDKMDCVVTAFMPESIPNLVGEQVRINNYVTAAQAYNYLAKGASTSYFLDNDKKHTWLSRTQADAIPCTKIEKESALEAIGIALPQIVVDTCEATDVEVSYFVTNKGDIFVWPPYYHENEDLFYINYDTVVTTPDGVLISSNDAKLMYKDDFEFVVEGVTIKVTSKTENTDNVLRSDITVEELNNIPSIYYKDIQNAESPEGIESKFIFDDRTKGKISEIKGVDRD